MEKLQQALRFLRFTDSEGNVSLTNLSLLVALVKIATMPAVALPDLAMFLGTVAAYSVRRAITMTPVDAKEENAALAESVAKLETKVSALLISRQ